MSLTSITERRPVSPLARLARGAHIDQIVDGGFCIGCGACAFVSKGELEMKLSEWGTYVPVAAIGGKRGEPANFSSLCPFGEEAPNEDQLAAEIFPHAPNVHEAIGRWRQVYVGHVETGDFRMQGSSGGFTSWLLATALASGEIDAVIHVGPQQPTDDAPVFFRYEVSRENSDVRHRSKSRYYPIEFSQALAQLRSVPGRYAFVGIPCFIKAIRLLMRQDPIVRERISLTIGLVCGHLKSAAMTKSFARQARVDPNDVTAVNFRLKQPQHRASRYTVDLQLKNGSHAVRDWSRMLDGDWGMGFFQYSACDYCDDVLAETADVSSGDAWVEPYTSDGRGTNVIVVRSPVVEKLVQQGIDNGELKFTAVDAEFAARTQTAGLRQRRQGLAYRRWKMRHKWHPPKRVIARKDHLSFVRRRIYDCRQGISHWSHRMFRFAESVRQPIAYWCWAWAMGKLYRALYKADKR